MGLSARGAGNGTHSAPKEMLKKMVYLEIEQELEILKNLLNSLERRSIDSAGLYFWGSNLEKARELPIVR